MPARGWSRAAALGALPSPYPTFFGLPPEPWPDIPPSYAFGSAWQPPGTIYTFDEASAIDRAAEHGHTWPWILEHVLGVGDFIDGTGTWEMPVRYARLQIHATLPGPEEIIHSLALRPVDEGAVVTGTVLHDLAVEVMGYMHDFTQESVPQAVLHTALAYDSCAISYIEQTTGTAKDGTGGNQHTLVPTIVVPVTPFGGGDGSGKLLPYEVAMALTLQTDTRGPSTRGRTYLGGFSSGALATNGLFGTATASGMGDAFGTKVIAQVHDNTSWRVNVVSRRNASAREVQGIAVGVVPDSQRRRRNQLAENYQQAWGTPPGAIPPG